MDARREWQQRVRAKDGTHGGMQSGERQLAESAGMA